MFNLNILNHLCSIDLNTNTLVALAGGVGKVKYCYLICFILLCLGVLGFLGYSALKLKNRRLGSSLRLPNIHLNPALKNLLKPKKIKHEGLKPFTIKGMKKFNPSQQFLTPPAHNKIMTVR